MFCLSCIYLRYTQIESGGVHASSGDDTVVLDGRLRAVRIERDEQVSAHVAHDVVHLLVHALLGQHVVDEVEQDLLAGHLVACGFQKKENSTKSISTHNQECP